MIESSANLPSVTSKGVSSDSRKRLGLRRNLGLPSVFAREVSAGRGWEFEVSRSWGVRSWKYEGNLGGSANTHACSKGIEVDRRSDTLRQPTHQQQAQFFKPRQSRTHSTRHHQQYPSAAHINHQPYTTTNRTSTYPVYPGPPRSPPQITRYGSGRSLPRALPSSTPFSAHAAQT